MPTPMLKLVVALLLVAQGIAALAPGQVLCIQIRDCDTHQQEGPATCGHCHGEAHDDEGRGRGCQNHTHGPLSVTAHASDDCGCHLHMPVPESDPNPSKPWSDNPDLRVVVVAQPVASAFAWGRVLSAAVRERFKPPDFDVTDQVLALKSTRLII